MNARASPHLTPPAGNPVMPLLRAVLLADLVDSTAFVQRHGDARAAVALRRLDLQIRDLLEFTGGRLIDKADGLLAIFERPIQAVDFALRYQQALRHFSASEGAVLTARVGIHVGEVMTWSNSAEAVAAGAKPLEVEGLAKPVAARLMSVALPGQILLSSMAQALAQRAGAELGERAERVRWIVHGRYRFKGVPMPLLVHEVGEVGHAPLRSPPSGQKVWRELPIWRRPPVLAMELLLFLAIGGFYAYSLLRSPPALAFNERDWVVLGDLSNFTGDPRLEQSLDTALRISLEQSRYVNVVPDLKVESALQRMGRSEKATVDRAIGSEIALREGARAVLLPSVAEVGGRLRVSLEVVDPNTQVTVYADAADGQGAQSVLASLDTLNSRLRERLGESLADIRANERPLEAVTTGNLDALRAYSLAMIAYRESRQKEALDLFQRALALDPKFAMAQLGLARIHWKNDQLPLGNRLARSARRNADRLSQRELLELDAFIARDGPVAASLASYRIWASLYPDAYRALYGFAMTAYADHRFAEALDTLTPALSPKNAMQANAYYLQGAILLALNRYLPARAAFQQSESLGVGGEKLEFAETYAAQRDFAGAQAVLDSQTRGGMAATDLRLHLADPLFQLDRGNWSQARASFAALQKQAEADSPFQARALLGARLSLDHYSGTLKPSQWREFIATESERLASKDNSEHDNAIFNLLAGGWLAARSGDLASATKALELARPAAAAHGEASLVGMQAIVEAELALARNQASTAIALLRARHDGSELYFSHAVLMRAYASQHNYLAALAEARWLAQQRGRAYAEWNNWDIWSAANIIESNLALLSGAEFALKLGQRELAQQQLAAFQRAWPVAAEPAFVVRRLQRLEAALKTR